MDMDRYLDVVGEYSDRLAQLGRTENRGTITVAESLDALFHSGEWVAEWLEVKPAPKRPNNNWTPDSQSRFAGWVAWKLEQKGRTPLHGRRTYQFLTAARIVKPLSALNNCSKLKPDSEGAIRPWAWLIRNGYEDRIPQVAQIAADMAGDGRITDTIAKDALAKWKRDTFGTRRDGTPRSSTKAIEQAANAKAIANRIRKQILRELDEMLALAGRDPEAHAELDAVFDDINAWVDAHAEQEDAA